MSRFLTATSAIALLAGGEALAFQRGAPAADGEVRRIAGNSWSITASVNHSDNFSRLPEGNYERRFILDDEFLAALPIIEEFEPGRFRIVPEIISDTIEVDNIPKTSASLTFSGTSVYSRPGLEGILRGQVRVGHFFDGDGFNEEIADELNNGFPQELLDEFPDSEITPTVAIPNFFEQTFIDPNISGLGTVELAGRRLFLEAGGFVTEQSRGGGGGALLQQAPGANINELIVGGFFVTPVSQWRLAGDQMVELRASHSAVYALDEPDEELFVGRQIEFGSSFNNEAGVLYTTGGLFSNLTAELEASGRYFEEEETETNPEQTFEQLSGALNMSYALTTTFALTGSVGYDDAELETGPLPEIFLPEVDDPDDPFVNDPRVQDLSAVFYNVGFDYKPRPDIRIAAGVGERYNQFTVRSNVSFPITPRMRFDASAQRRVTSGFQEAQEGARFGNAQGLQFVQQLRSQNRSLSSRDIERISSLNAGGNQLGGLANFNIQTVQSYRARLQGTYGRTTWALSADLLQNDPEFEEDDGRLGLVRQGDQYRADAFIERRVNRRLTVSARSQALATEVIPPENPAAEPVIFGRLRDDFVEHLHSVSANYQFGRNWSINARYSHLRRDIRGAEPDPISFFDGVLFEYQENQYRIGMRRQF
ncbi:hypothetical protein HK107_08035 [Parvularcula sp. ZS-1/3]|uniref:TonB-dependent receptor n=1 Tax=Parvularcula mediterranea TaxID=2732508 RepID=A0A7Y3W590_9PROT|nr:hypothetical protein [Parvularcula mediterranea]NNU16268.1 hypothetical protein [Parvularcula mediterranea]